MSEQDRLKMIQSHLDSVSLSVGQMEKFFKDLKLAHESCESGLREIIDTLASKFSELSQGAFSKGNFEQFKSYVESRFAQLAGHQTDFKGKILFIEDKLLKHVDGFGMHVKIADVHTSKLKDAHEKLSLDIAAIHKKICELFAYCDQSVSKSQEIVVDQLKKMIEEVKGSPSSIEAVKKEVMEKFENTKLDASNAVLRATYIEQRVKNLEKVIENLSLMVRQLESR